MLPPLTIIPAGAGSGKTHTIQHTLAKWIEEKAIDPQRIVAVTFTEAAAAELRERIKSRLLELGRLEDAIKLDQAYISTIHGFGKRLLTEFAFDVGMSPKPRLLNEDEESTLMRLALARTGKADSIIADLKKFGYSFDFNSGKSAEEVFRDDLLRVVAYLRSVGWDKESDHYATYAAEWIKAKYGKAFDGDNLSVDLQSAVKALLREFPENLAQDFGNSAAATKAFNADFTNLHKSLDNETVSTDWTLWKGLRELRLSKRGCALPERYDELGQVVREAADKLPVHSGPLADAVTHIETLLAAGQDILVHYAETKREAGLIDYSDMISIAEKMLRNQKEVVDALVSRIDCLVVDEFQDTNPLQFALLWQLTQAGVPTITVGDLKQAIMGFQGADPRLFETLIAQNHDIAEPLTSNWRSQPRIMDFVNALGPQLFGDEYIALEPQGKDSALVPIEFISFSDATRKNFHKIRASYVGQRLLMLLEDPEQQIIDRTTKISRQVRGGDMAILCPTGKMLTQYAAVLRAQGLTVKIQEEGWYSSRVVQLAIQALAYVGNPDDRHAALYLAVTELGHSTLEAALTQLMKESEISDPVLEILSSLSEHIADRTIYGLVADMLATLDLLNVIVTWPDALQARADVLRLQAEAGEYMDANREALASGGFHGSGIQSFLAWLKVKVGKRDQNNHPEAKVIDENAIELVTLHASKGREWPVVVVAGIDRDISPKLPTMELGYVDFEDLSNILETAQIQYSPKFPAKEADERFLEELRVSTDINARRLIYVALTRARDKLVIEWPGYLEDKDKQTYWSILADTAGISVGDDEFAINGQSFPCTNTFGRSDFPEGFDLEKPPETDQLATTGRRAITPGDVEEKMIPDSVTPSGMKDEGNEPADLALEILDYHPGITLETDITGVELGNLLHLGFEILGSDLGQIGKVSELAGITLEKEDEQKLIDIVSHFEGFIDKHFEAISISHELPILALTDEGSVISGIADIVIESEHGVWIIDHKSDQIVDPEEAFKKYQSQLECYEQAFSSMGKNVLGVGINWIRLGKISLQLEN